MNGLHTTSENGPRKEAEGAQQAHQPKLWRSLDELAKAPGFVEMLHREFPRQAAEWGNVDRRRFLQLTGASLALAGLTACDKQPPQKVVPYVRQPEDLVPGKPMFFATAVAYAGYGQGVLAESHMGRPTKIEGNPDHPASLGATDIHAQASVLDLYDPDRSQGVYNLGQLRSWESFVRQVDGIRAALVPVQGDGLRFLTGNVTSPTLARLMGELLAEMPKAGWHVWEPLLGQRPAAIQQAFGSAAEVRYAFDKANVVLAVDADFLHSGPQAVANAKAFASRRRAHDLDSARAMNRLYSVETMPTGTSSVADHRLAVKPTEMLHFLVALAAQLGVAGASKPAGFEGGTLAAWVEEVAADLAANRGASVVVVGDYLDVEAQVLGFAINEHLGNLGQTVLVTEAVAASSPSPRSGITELYEDIKAGKVKTLVFLGTNPFYGATADLDFAAVIDKVALRIQVGLLQDETAEYCQWQVAESHGLESWGDIRSIDGTATIVQPLVNPLYDSKPSLSVVAAFLGQAAKGADQLVKETWQAKSGLTGAAFEKWWRRALHDGLVAGSASPAKAVSVQPAAAAQAVASLAGLKVSQGELLYRPDPTILDGRFANNGWLQECPKPVTKLTWDNALMMSPRTAQQGGLGEVLNGAEQLPWAPMVALEVAGKVLQVAVWIVPGMADDALLLHLGYGRRRGGKTLEAAGFNANALRTTSAEWRANASFRPTDEQYTLASTQDHHSMEGRAPVQMTNVQTWEKHPDSPLNIHLHVNPALTMMPGKDYNYADKVDRNGNLIYRWGMSIDLTSCTGCNACLVACVAENNIPAIGKDQVRRGREMHWIRIDRYFTGDDPDHVEDVVNQPVPCMQCEQAPCEVVCPVAATVHSDEGLNDMVYNRCVGTRYCSNNCPYKVRRFNFLLYQDFETDSLKLGRNPDVSIRSRGVMEKCTYCVQRINQARIQTKAEKRRIKDGEVVTACQQVCPSDAIVFGDLNDKSSKIAKVKESHLDYTLLEELGNRPRTTYLGRVANPNAKLWQRLYPNRPLVEERHGAHPTSHGAQGAHGEPAPAGH